MENLKLLDKQNAFKLPWRNPFYRMGELRTIGGSITRGGHVGFIGGAGVRLLYAYYQRVLSLA